MYILLPSFVVIITFYSINLFYNYLYQPDTEQKKEKEKL